MRGLERLCCLWRLTFGECRFGEAAGLLAAAGKGEDLAGTAEAGEIIAIELIANKATLLIFPTFTSTFVQRYVISIEPTRAFDDSAINDQPQQRRLYALKRAGLCTESSRYS